MTNPHKLVDIDFALSQLSGNKELLARMLVKFSAEFRSVPNKVIQAIEKNDLQEAKLQVHTTKGLSGNLGLIALYECSKSLDQKIRNGVVDESELHAFDNVMTSTCDYIKGIDLNTDTPRSFSNSKPAEENSDKNTFLQRLQRNEFIDDKTLFIYIDALSLSEEKKLELKGLVEELNYTKAIELIEQNA